MRRFLFAVSSLCLLPCLGVVLLWMALPSPSIPESELATVLQAGEPVVRAYQLEKLLLRQCTGNTDITPDTYTILNIKYYRTWKTLSINGDPIPLDSGPALDAEPVVRLSPIVRISTTKDLFNLRWFNPADAALFSSQRHPERHCALPLRLEVRPGHTKDLAIFDIAPDTSPPSNMTLLTIMTRSGQPLSFHFSAPEFAQILQASPSSTWNFRAGILLPLLRYFVFNMVFVYIIASAALCVGRVWAHRHRRARLRDREGGRNWQLLSPGGSPRRGLSQFWRDVSPSPSRLDSVITRLMQSAIMRGKAGASSLVGNPSSNSPIMVPTIILPSGDGGKSRSPSPRGRSEKRLSMITEEDGAVN